MATISNVSLSIQKGGSGTSRQVVVRYRLCFTSCEALAGSVFVENVALRGDDPIFDDHLTTLRNSCVKAERECLDRTLVANVSRSTLDEDGDTIILGWPVWADTDEVYARITLTPFTPSGSSANSNIATGQWGAAGSD